MLSSYEVGNVNTAFYKIYFLTKQTTGEKQ